MLIYYHANHLAHDQARLHQPDDTHSVVYYSEVAQRGPLIHDAIVAAGLGVIQPPQDFGLAPIVEVHRHEMVAFLQTAHERFVAETGRDVALPETFSIGERPRRKPVSVWGLLGYYCFDIGSPIFAGTWPAAYGSAQTAVTAAAAIANGERLAYALCRPPGTTPPPICLAVFVT